jgi:hypothetical protein
MTRLPNLEQKTGSPLPVETKGTEVPVVAKRVVLKSSTLDILYEDDRNIKLKIMDILDHYFFNFLV